MGIGSFGPIDIQKESEKYGYITSTPKSGWRDFDFVGTIRNNFQLPVAWTTDVNAACYGEYIAGSAKRLGNVVYYTIGTGVGGGAIQQGRFVEGFSHPEMGHMLVKLHKDDQFKGNCSFHANCLEGMASGPAIEKRVGKKGQELSENDPVWNIIATYIAQCAYNTTLLFSPEAIILGGGVMKQTGLIEKVRDKYSDLLNDYVQTPDINKYIITPYLKDDAGITGCIALARELSGNYKSDFRSFL